MSKNEHATYDVIVIGGGVTGAGVARDCALRGLNVLLLERHDYNHGASGRNHGLMHSGGRYAVTDPDSARECIQENEVLRRIACHCIEPTDGLFVTLPDDDLDYQATFVEACRQVGISAEGIDPSNIAKALEEKKILDLLFGTFFICGLGEENFTDIPEQAIPKYSKMFSCHEYLIKTERGIGVFTIKKNAALSARRAERKNMMDYKAISLKGTEYLYTYRNSQQISGQTGLVGYLRADFGSSDNGFFNTWNEFRADYNTDEFKADFYAVIDYFREKNRFLHRRRDMENFCYEVSNTFEYSNGREYGVRVDTEHYAFLMRLNPYKGEYNLYCYCYRKDWLDSHLERAKKGIRFIDSGYNDLFILPDGGTIE